jgi:hypothetical protein
MNRFVFELSEVAAVVEQGCMDIVERVSGG